MDLQGDPPQAKVLLVRGGYDYLTGNSAAKARLYSKDEALPLMTSPGYPQPRQTIPVQRLNSSENSVWFAVQSEDAQDHRPLVLDEIGLFAEEGDISRFLGFQLDRESGSLFVSALRALLAVTIALSVVVAWTRGRGATGWIAAAGGLAIVTASLVVLAHDYGPEWSRDIRIFIASVPLQQSPGSNSNYGIFMAERIRMGRDLA